MEKTSGVKGEWINGYIADIEMVPVGPCDIQRDAITWGAVMVWVHLPVLIYPEKTGLCIIAQREADRHFWAIVGWMLGQPFVTTIKVRATKVSHFNLTTLKI